MNNASFHLPGRHPLLMVPNHSMASAARILTNDPPLFAMANGSMPVCPTNPQLQQMGFSPFANAPGFPYFNFGNFQSMMPMGIGMFQQHANLYSKSPGITPPMTGMFSPFSSTKEEDLPWNKRSPSNQAESPRSDSRNSPLDLNKRIPNRSRLPHENNACPICGQNVPAKNLQEHFVEELKTYLGCMDKQKHSQSPAPRTPKPATPSDSNSNSKLEVFQRVKQNRATRGGATAAPRHKQPSQACSSSESPSKRRRSSDASMADNLPTPSPTPTKPVMEQEEDSIVDVEGDNEDTAQGSGSFDDEHQSDQSQSSKVSRNP